MQAAGQRDYALFALVGGEKSFSFFFVRVAGFFILLLHLSLHFFLHFHDRGLRFLVGEQGLVAGKRVFDAARHDVGVNGNRLLLEIRPHLHPDGVAEFFFLRLESERSRSLRGRGGFLRRWSLSLGG